MKGRGQASLVSQLLVAFVAIALVIFLYFMFYGRYLDVQVIVQSNEVERRAINAAQVLMSSKDLVWYDSGAERFYRGVFDEAKLDAQMVSADSYAENRLQTLSKGVLKNYLTFLGTVTSVTVRSADTTDAWFTSFADFSNPDSTNFYACVANSLGLSFFVKYDACVKTYTGSNTFEKAFPVLLVDASGTLHPASMTVVMTST